MRLLRLPLLALIVVFALARTAAAEPHAIAITPAIAKDLKRVSDYLEGIKTLKAKFLQISSTGDTATGQILLSRPKQLRIEYDPPSPILIIADGEYLSYVDKELKQVNHMKVDDTPAAFLLRKKFKFVGGGLTVVGFDKAADTVRVSLVQTKDPLAGELTLVFSDNPLVLRKWTIVDAQGVVTNITLVNPVFDYPIPANKFDDNFPMFDLGR